MSFLGVRRDDRLERDDDGFLWVRRIIPPMDLLREAAAQGGRFGIIDPPDGDLTFLEEVADCVTEVLTNGYVSRRSNDFLTQLPALQHLSTDGEVSPGVKVASPVLVSFGTATPDLWAEVMRPVASLREICLGGGRWDWTRGGSYRLRTLLLREHRGVDVVTLDDSTRGLTSLEIIGGTHMALTALGAVEPLARLELRRIRRVSGMAALRPGRLDELWLEAIGTVDEPRALLTEHPRDVHIRPRSPFVEATREQPVARERGWMIGPSKVG